ncbi:kinase domain-containing [Pyrenophora seminiperda CCB06]|uniref:Kinase domain-containing n=1 Tax=Pyrenophora seminiperda CCB06 TaxID=1302712 RepID=A0A3M7MFZ7_9PLEO|nr:kinase domain-containing [Pyrenophora seminiperda CCB06]
MALLSADNNAESSRSRSRQRARTEVGKHSSMWERLNLQKIGSWLKKEEQEPPPPSPVKAEKKAEEVNKENARPHSSGGLLGRRGSRKVIPGLPRPLTFKRLQSEKRDKLLEVPDQGEQRRAASVDLDTLTRPRDIPILKRELSPPPQSVPSVSAPDLLSPREPSAPKEPPPEVEWEVERKVEREVERTIGGGPDSNIPAGARQVDYGIEEPEDDFMFTQDMPSEPPPLLPPPPPPPQLELAEAFSEHGSHHSGEDIDDIRLQEELEAKWILNLSMHFRDMSDREKFFVTFAEEPNRWRRVTVSCDYRHLEPDSLEADLKTLHYQRDKSSRIYEAIRDSLPAIQFYDTVTNLKLETADGRLHVHVTEDVNEIIPYPASSSIDHLDCKRFRENAVSFDSHISGFVYKVSVNNRTYIKKEIPGPDAVEEFLYEINALVSLQESKSVIRFEGVIVDEQNELIKGLLISYAEQGALVDMIYDFKPTGQLYWGRRERWARQIIEGLSEIHEAGFVQGDFTLSNIVIDNDDNAKIIDINRRGCPVGWEPPELAKLIESGQRISIYIGVKSDLYQLGMVLWALAEQQDEPERQPRPLVRSLDRQGTDVPVYFRDIIRACLSDTPRARPSATTLLKWFPEETLEHDFKPRSAVRNSVSTHRSDKEYIDPRTAVDLEDISQHRRHSRQQSSYEEIHVSRTEYPASSGSYIIPNNQSERGRSPGPLSVSDRNRRSDCSPYPGHRSVMSLDDSELENELASLPASRETRWEQVYVDGDTKLVQRGCDIDVRDFGTQEPKDICIGPPSDMDNSFLGSKPSDDAPLGLSMPGGLQPIEPPSLPNSLQEPSERGHNRSVDSHASFSDRVHHLAQTQPPPPPKQEEPERIETPDYYYDSQNPQRPEPAVLADLEYDVAVDSSATSTNPPSRVSTGFSIFELPENTRRVGTAFMLAPGYRMLPHQDSGFEEPERVSYESERIRYSLDESIKDFSYSPEDEPRIDERLWDEKDGTLFGESINSKLESKAEPIPTFTMPPSPKKEEEQSGSSMPPPSLPSVGPTNVLSVTDVQNKGLEEKNSDTTIRPRSIHIPDANLTVPKAVDSMDVATPVDPVPTPKQTSKPTTSSSSTPKPKSVPPPARKPPSPTKDTSRKHTTPNPRNAKAAPRDPLYDEYMSAGEDDDEEEDHGRSASNDLSDYLSHSIAFDHSIDFYISEHGNGNGNKNINNNTKEKVKGESSMNGNANANGNKEQQKKIGIMGSRGPKV